MNLSIEVWILRILEKKIGSLVPRKLSRRGIADGEVEGDAPTKVLVKNLEGGEKLLVTTFRYECSNATDVISMRNKLFDGSIISTIFVFTDGLWWRKQLIFLRDYCIATLCRLNCYCKILLPNLTRRFAELVAVETLGSTSAARSRTTIVLPF